MAATVINPIITNAGLAAAQAQSGLGLQLAITHVQLGSSAYTLDTTVGSADYNRTALVTPTETVAIAAGHVMDKGFRVDAQFPGWVGTVYGPTEIGFWAGDPAGGGVLFALWAQPTAFAQRNNIDYLASFAVALTRVPAGSITVTFDPSLSQALAVVNFHEQAADPHPQYKRGTGIIFTVPAINAPPGAVKANGALLSRTTYADLWAFAQASGNISANDGAWQSGGFSPGDGSTTFRIPDGRGYTARGWDNGRGIDSGRAIGSVQNDQFPAHTHLMFAHEATPIAAAAMSSSLQVADSALSGTDFAYTLQADVNPANVGKSGSAGTGTETRVKSLAWLACIYF